MVLHYHFNYSSAIKKPKALLYQVRDEIVSAVVEGGLSNSSVAIVKQKDDYRPSIGFMIALLLLTIVISVFVDPDTLFKLYPIGVLLVFSSPIILFVVFMWWLRRSD